jgi:small subunit ribosomal protein S9
VSEEETPQEQASEEPLVGAGEEPQEPTPIAEAPAPLAVPGEEAEQIAAVAEDAPLEAYEEAQAKSADVVEAAEAEAEAEAEAVEVEVAEAEVEAIEAIEAVEAEVAEAEVEAVEAEVEAIEAVEAEVAEAEVEAVEAEVEAIEVAEVEVAEAEVEAVEAEVEAAEEVAVAIEGDEDEGEDEEEPAPRVKPAVPGAHLEVDIVPEGVDPLGRGESYDPYAIEDEEPEAQEQAEEEEEPLAQPISTAAIDLAAGARYRATGKRKTAVARVTLQPGSGEYKINGRTLDAHFSRATLQRNIRQPLETVGYQERMDVIALLHGGGISAQAGALRHGISRALLEADPNLRGELKRRGFLTRDSRAKERKKAGLKKARKRPQFSKR